MLQDKVLDRLLEAGYASGDEVFRVMVEAFGYGRDDRHLPEAVKMAHQEMRCRADMDRWLLENLEALDISRYSDAADTPWGGYILREFHSFLRKQTEKFRKALEEMALYPNLDKGLRKTFEQNLQQLELLNSCTGWDEVRANRIVSFGRAVVRKPEDAAVKERLAKVRTLCWSELKGWQELFFADSKSVLADLAQAAPGAQALLRFAKTFDEAYLAEKRRRKLLDFSDLEHEAIRLLTDRYTGKPSKTAREVSRRFKEILVDEYQDSNQVQDSIFEAVSREGQNRFMVGDVKQSIYRFRLADPSIFLRKYEAYPDHSQAEQGSPRRIVLSENFRSRPEILSACNDVFGLVMRKSVGDLDYGDVEALRPGRSFPPADQPPVELHCLTSSDPEEPQDKCELEAEYTASLIRRMLDEKVPVTDADGTRPVQAGDIVILMRSLSGTAGAYLEALGQHGIPAVCDRGGSLLDTSEVQILVAILQILDNPHQDVPLLTAMASPVFGFTPDELALPRTRNRKDDFFDTISAAGGKFEPFLTLIQTLREDARWMNLQELIDSVFRRTGLLSIFSSMPDGLRRERNLMAFRSFAGSFASNGTKTLAQLLWYLADLQTNGGQLPLPKASAKNAVSIMTVHSSKGLEFPVVFLCDLSRKFNLRDMQDAVLVDNELAVGCSRVDHERFVRYPTLAKKAIIRKKTAEAVSEELRVLYVAMTRAKDRLVMMYYSKHLISELKNLNSQLTIPLSDDLCASARSPGKWILMAALCRTESGELLKLVEGNDVSHVREHPWKIVYKDLFAHAEMEAQSVLRDLEPFAADPGAVKLLQFRYGHEAVCAVPAKVTATQLKGRFQDEEAAQGAVEHGAAPSFQFRRANFLPGRLTSAERGTATHLFLQFASYEACVTEETLCDELERLCREEFLTQEQAEAVRLDQILAFFCSQWGRWLLLQKEVRREFKFSLLVDAGAFDPAAAGERSMLQGVVDCFVLEEDGITILDFKTDRVGDRLDQLVCYYKPQLEAYSNALTRIYGKPVKRRILYFFSASEAVVL